MCPVSSLLVMSASQERSSGRPHAYPDRRRLMLGGRWRHQCRLPTHDDGCHRSPPAHASRLRLWEAAVGSGVGLPLVRSGSVVESDDEAPDRRQDAAIPTCLPRSGSWRRSAALPKDAMTEPWRAVAVLAWRVGRRRRWPQTTGPASSTRWRVVAAVDRLLTTRNRWRRFRPEESSGRP